MATMDFESLQTKYDGFQTPTAVIKINDRMVTDEKLPFQISDIEVDLTCGYEASIASFHIYNVYSTVKGQFETEEIQKYIYLGSKVEIYLGYGATAKLVFVGVIAKVAYQMLEYEVPCIQVTSMDAKSIMMAGNYSRQLKATQFTEAAKEILMKTAYARLQSKGIIRNIQVSQPVLKPSVDGASADQTIEMVAESDYEFLVKLAKKNNY